MPHPPPRHCIWPSGSHLQTKKPRCRKVSDLLVATQLCKWPHPDSMVYCLCSEGPQMASTGTQRFINRRGDNHVSGQEHLSTAVPENRKYEVTSRKGVLLAWPGEASQAWRWSWALQVTGDQLDKEQCAQAWDCWVRMEGCVWLGPQGCPWRAGQWGCPGPT